MRAHLLRRLILPLFAVLAFTNPVDAQWQVQQLPNTTTYLNAVHFADRLHGWIVGQYNTIFYTTDGGNNWIDESLIDSGSTLCDVYALNESTAWAVGTDTLVLKTTDYGITWQRQHLNVPFLGQWTAYTVYFADSAHGWIGGVYAGVVKDTSFVLRTTDGGRLWHRDTLAHSCGEALIRGTNSQHLWATCLWCYVMTTTDGRNWNFPGYHCGYNNQIVDAVFPTPAVGWMTIYYEAATTYVSKTIDSGYTWTGQLLTGCGSYYIFLSFPDTTHGWVVKSACTGGCIGIWATTDGGANWNQQYCYTPAPRQKQERIFFIDSLNGWVVGDFGMILHTSNGGISTGVTEKRNALPSGFELSQNYPNPFNPSTSIKYKIPTSTHVTIQIYDLLGRVIATLVDERKPPGSYTVEFHPGEHVASGVLLCRMNTQFGTITRSLIVLK